MFTWLLIIIAIAFIFGVIKVEQVKNFVKKHEPKVRELFNKTKTIIEQKIAETKKDIENKKATASTQKNDVVEEKKEENTNNTDAN